jgi:hypothetical protein
LPFIVLYVCKAPIRNLFWFPGEGNMGCRFVGEKLIKLYKNAVRKANAAISIITLSFFMSIFLLFILKNLVN